VRKGPFFKWFLEERDLTEGKRIQKVGETGFEPATPCTPCKCATRLRYSPISFAYLLLAGAATALLNISVSSFFVKRTTLLRGRYVDQALILIANRFSFPPIVQIRSVGSDHCIAEVVIQLCTAPGEIRNDTSEVNF
jgi:hypothetical protein